MATKKKHKKPGPPPLGLAPTFTVRILSGQYQGLKSLARKKKMSISGVIRELLGDPTRWVI